jgi:hypothetical protein
MQITKRTRHLHLRHSWVLVAHPGEPVQLQCMECCKVRALYDPDRVERQAREAQNRRDSPYA